MKIGLDFDGVIADYPRVKSQVAKALFGKEIAADLLSEQKIINNNLLTIEQYRLVQLEACTNPAYMHRMKPIKGAIGAIQELEKEHEIRIVTSRSGEGLELARQWLAKYRIQCECVGVGYKASKVQALTGEEIFVDDGLSKLLHLVGLVPNLFYFSAMVPEGMLPESLVVTPDWKTVLKRVKALR